VNYCITRIFDICYLQSVEQLKGTDKAFTKINLWGHYCFAFSLRPFLCLTESARWAQKWSWFDWNDSVRGKKWWWGWKWWNNQLRSKLNCKKLNFFEESWFQESIQVQTNQWLENNESNANVLHANEKKFCQRYEKSNRVFWRKKKKNVNNKIHTCYIQ